MSRTTRRVLFGWPPGRWKHASVFDHKDLDYLRHPPKLRDQNRGRWVKKWGRMVYAPTQYTVKWNQRLYSYWEERGHYKPIPEAYWRSWEYNGVVTKYPPQVNEYESDRWEPNPDFDQEAYDYYYEWWQIHSWVYRNGSCIRKQKNSNAINKRLAHRKKRRAGERELMREIREYWIEKDNDER